MMARGNDFLSALAVVLGVAAVTTVLFHRLRQPVVLGYMLAGLIVGPHLPIPLVADPEIVHTLSEIGIIFLMFSLGLEFSFRKLVKVGPTAGVTAIGECSLMFWLGFAVGRAFGWPAFDSLFAGAILSISSTTIVARAFDEQRVTGKLRERVVGVLIAEDLIAILLMATLTAIATGRGVSLATLAATSGRLLAFLVALVVGGLLVVPRVMRAVVALRRPETTLVASVGVCFCVALLAQGFGYSVALGAFIAGSLVAESGEERTIEPLIQPVRDLFAAIFFVSVGMMLDPLVLVRDWLPILVLTVVVVAGKFVGVSTGAFLTGSGTRTAVQAGMSLAQIGEFSFIIAGLGVALDPRRGYLYAIAVAVSALTTLFTPWLIRASGPVASWVDRKLPAPLQTFAALYASWLERLRSSSSGSGGSGREASAVRRLGRMLALDAAILASLVVGTVFALPPAASLLAAKLGVSSRAAAALVLVGVVVLALPFALGVIRVSQKLGLRLAEAALPITNRHELDLAAAPRRALVVALQLASVLLVGAPLVAVTQPFLPGWWGAGLLLVILLFLALAFWRKAADLHGHVQAGAQVIVEALAAQSKSNVGAHATRSLEANDPLDRLKGLWASFGAPRAITLEPASPAVGRTLAELDVRALTGAVVLAITRPDEAVLVPAANERLREGDILAVAGTTEAVHDAAVLLTGRAA
jgi:CPA2 family monovalent cation:H+ antiporter-2